MPLADALGLAKARRGVIHPNAGFLDALRRFQAMTAAGPAPPPTAADADEGAREFADFAVRHGLVATLLRRLRDPRLADALAMTDRLVPPPRRAPRSSRCSSSSTRRSA